MFQASFADAPQNDGNRGYVIAQGSRRFCRAEAARYRAAGYVMRVSRGGAS